MSEGRVKWCSGVREAGVQTDRSEKSACTFGLDGVQFPIMYFSGMSEGSMKWCSVREVGLGVQANRSEKSACAFELGVQFLS